MNANPYAAPLSDHAPPTDTLAVREGHDVGLLLGVELPPICAKCAGKAATHRAIRIPQSREGALVAGVLVGVGIHIGSLIRGFQPGAVVGIGVVLLPLLFPRNVLRVDLPLCLPCTTRWTRATRNGRLFLGLSLGIPLVLFPAMHAAGHEWAGALAALFGIWILWLLLVPIGLNRRYGNPDVQATRATPSRIWVRGLHPATVHAWSDVPPPAGWTPPK